METVWRRVKGGLMPRRYYEDVAAAVVAGLKQLGLPAGGLQSYLLS
jgi:hypothetical protein